VVETYFSPQDPIAPRIVERIDAAEHSIQFMAFSFTHDGIGAAMRERHRAGVKVRGVFERTGSQTRFSEYHPLREAGAEVYQDGNPYVTHHKVIVLDERLTMFGSYNFSANAEDDNDENIMFVEDATLAGHFLAEVERVVEAARR